MESSVTGLPKERRRESVSGLDDCWPKLVKSAMTSGDAGFGVRLILACIWRRRAGVGSKAGRNALLPVEHAMNILA